MGLWQFDCEWNLAAAERSFKRALQANPTRSELYLIYGGVLDAMGRFEEAIEVIRRALSSDPTSPTAHIWMSLTYLNRRRYADALQWVQKAINLDPGNPMFHINASAIHYAAGNYEAWGRSLGIGAPPRLMAPLPRRIGLK